MKKIPVCSILGVHIAAIDMKTALDYIQQNIRELKGKYICVSNVHTTVMSYENDEYRNIQNSGALALPDGKPLSVFNIIAFIFSIWISCSISLKK